MKNREWSERIIRAVGGVDDPKLARQLANRSSQASYEADALRLLAALPLDVRQLPDGSSDLLAGIAFDLEQPANALPAIVNMAARFAREEEFEDAADLYRRAFRLALVCLGDEHRDTPGYLNGLARVYYRSGDYRTAETAFERAIHMRSRIMGTDHSDTAISQTGLARVFEAQGRYAEAVALHRQALASYETGLGREHPDTGVGLNDLGCALLAVAEANEARECFERALVISRVFDGDDDPNTAIVLGNLAQAKAAEGETFAARDLHAQSLQILDRAGASGATLGWSLGNLAAVEFALGNPLTARQLAERALALDWENGRSDQLVLAGVLNNRAALAKDEGDYVTADREYRRAFGLVVDLLGEQHPLALAVHDNLSRFDVITASRQSRDYVTLARSIPWEGQSFVWLLTQAA